MAEAAHAITSYSHAHDAMDAMDAAQAITSCSSTHNATDSPVVHLLYHLVLLTALCIPSTILWMMKNASLSEKDTSSIQAPRTRKQSKAKSTSRSSAQQKAESCQPFDKARVKMSSKCASFFATGRSGDSYLCISYTHDGTRCNKTVGRSSQAWAESLCRLLSTLEHVDQDFNALVTAYAEFSLCGVHRKYTTGYKTRLRDKWLEEIRNAFRDDWLDMAAIPSSDLREHRIVTSQRSQVAPCAGEDCFCQIHRYTLPGSFPLSALDLEMWQMRSWPLTQAYTDRFGVPSAVGYVEVSVEDTSDDGIPRTLSDPSVRTELQQWIKVSPQGKAPNTASPLSIVVDEIRKDLTNDDLKCGHIYAFVVPSSPEYIKIGYTASSLSERVRYLKTCDPDLELVGHTTANVPFVKRAERLIHLRLQAQGLRRHNTRCQNRFRLDCGSCCKVHTEWFETSAAVVHSAIEEWINWSITSGSYDAGGKPTTQLLRVHSRRPASDQRDHAEYQLMNILKMSKPISTAPWKRLDPAIFAGTIADVHNDSPITEPTPTIVQASAFPFDAESRPSSFSTSPAPSRSLSTTASPPPATPSRPALYGSGKADRRQCTPAERTTHRQDSAPSTPGSSGSANSVFSISSTASSATNTSEHLSPGISERKASSSSSFSSSPSCSSRRSRLSMTSESPGISSPSVSPSPSPSASQRRKARNVSLKKSSSVYRDCPTSDESLHDE